MSGLVGQPRQFRHKPVVIEAMQYTGDEESSRAVRRWADSFAAGKVAGFFDGEYILVVYTLEGPMRAAPGWWIVRGVQGELYPVRPDIFEQTYEAVA